LALSAAPLAKPTRFREAISTLHDCVIGDLRFKKRDKTAYQDWKKNQGSRDAAVRTRTRQTTRLRWAEALQW
jgi:hypothetical protein